MPKVSVIIPVYNVEAYLRQCLDSVVNQTLRDIEIICVDDGSTDSSPAILAEYAAKDSRMKVLTREHMNAGAARNAGMAVATGEYLGFVDSDDWCEPMLFEEAYAKAKSDDADVVFWGCRDRDGISGKILRDVPFALPAGVRAPFAGSSLGDKVFSIFGFAPWNRIVRRDMVIENGLKFQAIERSNDVAFGCLAIAVASRISTVGEVRYNYRVRSEGNLQSGNGRTPLSIVEAWKFLVSELSRLGLLEKNRHGVALASMYSFSRTLGVLVDSEGEYKVLFDALRRLFSEDVFFATVNEREIGNDILANTLKAIRTSETFSLFALRQASDTGRWMAKFYRDREAARKELGEMRTETASVAEELSKARAGLTETRKDLAIVKDGLSALLRERREELERRRLPGVSLVVVSDGDPDSRERFESHVEQFSIHDREVIYVDDVSAAALDNVSRDYVAIIRDNDRYVNDYALELLVNTARCENADVVGGYRSDSVMRTADFVFDATWLRANKDLLPVLRTDDQAFLAAAVARAGKHVVGDRVYTEYVRPVLSPLVTIVVPAYNAEPYIDRCIGSLVSQTYRNLEIIIVDDGSTDATAAMCDAWAEKDGRIRVVHKENGGQSTARNVGMRMAAGKYIGFVDADDYVDVEMFGHLTEVLECHPKCDVAKCGVAVEYTYEVSSAELKATQAYFQNPGNGEIRPGYDIVHGTDVGPVDKLYRTCFLRGNGIEFPEGIKNEDEAFFFVVFCRIRNCYYVPQKYYHYLRNETGTMALQQKSADDGRIPDTLKVFEFVAELLERENRRDLLGVLYRHMVGCVQRFIGKAVEESVREAAARILWRTNAFYYVDLICGGDRQWVMRQVHELMNGSLLVDRSPTNVPEEWFPKVAPVGIQFDERPLVSFIVPVYNVEKYIAVALETLRRQTLPGLEIVCIDDGSIDDSGKILDLYARVDPRIKVWHVENGGVSRARSLGLEKALGRYVAFFDGDDRLHPRMAARTVLLAARDRLDVVMFDYRCFAYDSLKPVDHYWRLANHIGKYPQDRAFSPADLSRLPIYGSCCTYLWDRAFLDYVDVGFPGIKLGEDLIWTLSTLSRVRRMRVLNIPFYEYRRGNPSSAVSRLQTGECEAPVLALKGLADILAGVKGHKLHFAFLDRMISDILFYGEKMPKARKWLCNQGFDAFGGVDYLKRIFPVQVKRIDALLAKEMSSPTIDIEYFIRQTPSAIQSIMRTAIEERKNTVKDAFIICGQLNSTTNEPIDSWTFFRWLQDHGVPCRYVAWRKHCMVERMRTDNGLKDVLLLSGNGVDDFEFIEKCRDLLSRLKAVVMENTALNPLTWRYFHMLEDCSYIFLQHGPTFWKMAPKHISAFAVANYVNVASESEKEFLEKYVPEHWETGRKPRYLIAGLPRWDLLKDESESEREKVVFYMPTWRAAFNSGMDTIAKSAYFSGVKALVSEENIARLKRKGLRMVMAAHHHLVNHVKDLDFGLPVQLVPSSEISYWIRHASLCITDYSSVSFDFLFLNKPCIFWTPDRYDGLLKGDDYAEVVFAEHQGKNMFNRVSSVEDVLSMIEMYADSGFVLEPEKRAVSDRYFACRHNVCERLYGQICAIDGKEVGQ